MPDFHKGPPKKVGTHRASDEEDEDAPQAEVIAKPTPEIQLEPHEQLDQEDLNASCDRSIANARIQAKRRLLKNDPELLALFDKREAEKAEKAAKEKPKR